jgi:hypothetical protein
VGRGTDDRPPDIFSDTQLGAPRRSAVVTGDWKVIESMTPVSRFEVYDLHADPAERNDVAAAADVVLGYGRQLLAQWAARVPRLEYEPGEPSSNPTMDDETRRRLEALGYVQQQGETP